jgi:hypothetical protein
LQAVLFTESNNNERATSLLQHLVPSFLQPIFKYPIEKVYLPAWFSQTQKVDTNSNVS